HEETWKLHLIDTGLDTLTGGRVRRLAPFISGGTFMLTYGDGVSDVPLDRLVAFHRSHGKLATVTAVPGPARLCNITLRGRSGCRFRRKARHRKCLDQRRLYGDGARRARLFA